MSLETRIPKKGEYPEFYSPYIQSLEDHDLIRSLSESHQQSLSLFGAYPESEWNYRYDSGKWTIRELLAHLTDSERIFSVRALRFARNDSTSLAGFEQNDYIEECLVNHRTVPDLLEEWTYIRKATIKLFENFNSEMLHRTGIASGWPISVMAIGFVIVGHEEHHQNVFRERYF